MTEDDSFEKMVLDLDRCPHGRHEGDACAGWRGGDDLFDGGCMGGFSLGNPYLTAGQPIGFDISGRSYVMPPRGERHDPAAWR